METHHLKVSRSVVLSNWIIKVAKILGRNWKYWEKRSKKSVIYQLFMSCQRVVADKKHFWNKFLKVKEKQQTRVLRTHKINSREFKCTILCVLSVSTLSSVFSLNNSCQKKRKKVIVHCDKDGIKTDEESCSGWRIRLGCNVWSELG